MTTLEVYALVGVLALVLSVVAVVALMVDAKVKG